MPERARAFAFLNAAAASGVQPDAAALASAIDSVLSATGFSPLQPETTRIKERQTIVETTSLNLIVPPLYASCFWISNERFAWPALSEREAISWEWVDERVWVCTVAVCSVVEVLW